MCENRIWKKIPGACHPTFNIRWNIMRKKMLHTGFLNFHFNFFDVVEVAIIHKMI
jgi:hypothetical protein